MAIERDPAQLLHDLVTVRVRNECGAVRNLRHPEDPTRQFCFAAGTADCYGIMACVALGTVCDSNLQGVFVDVFAQDSQTSLRSIYIPTDFSPAESGERTQLAFATGLYGDLAEAARFDVASTNAYRQMLMTGCAALSFWQPE